MVYTASFLASEERNFYSYRRTATLLSVAHAHDDSAGQSKATDRNCIYRARTNKRIELLAISV